MRNNVVVGHREKRVLKIMAVYFELLMEEMYKYITAVFGPLPTNMIYSENGNFDDCVKLPMTNFSTCLVLEVI